MRAAATIKLAVALVKVNDHHEQERGHNTGRIRRYNESAALHNVRYTPMPSWCVCPSLSHTGGQQMYVRKIFVREEPQDLQCLPTILAIRGVEDVSIYPDFPIWEI